MIVCSQTPNAALEAEWEEHDLAKYVAAICGQEIGSKKESLTNAKKYPAESHADDRRRPRRLQSRRRQRLLVFPDQPGRRRSLLAASL